MSGMSSVSKKFSELNDEEVVGEMMSLRERIEQTHTGRQCIKVLERSEAKDQMKKLDSL